MLSRPLHFARWLGLAALILTVLSTNVGASCCVGSGCDDQSSSNGVKTFDKHDVSFQYPGTWKTGSDTAAAAAGNRLWSEAVGKDNDNLVLFSAYRLTRVLTADDFSNGEVDGEIRDSLSSDDTAKIDDSATAARYAGLTGVSYTGTTTSGNKTSSHRWVFVFSGNVQYVFNCTWIDKGASEVNSACDQVLDTLKIAGAGG